MMIGYLQSPSASICVELFKVLWHFLDLGVVMILDLPNELGIIWNNKVDSDTLSTKSSSSTDSVNVVFFFEWELVVDNESDLLNIDTSGQQISGDKNSCGSSSEFLHDCVSLHLIHFTVHSRYSEILLVHVLFELSDPLLGVAVNKRLIDVQVGVKIEKYLHFPIFFFDGNIILTDTLKSEIFTLNQDFLWISHEVLSKA